MKIERLDKKLVCFEWFKNIKAYVLKAFTKDIPLNLKGKSLNNIIQIVVSNQLYARNNISCEQSHVTW